MELNTYKKRNWGQSAYLSHGNPIPGDYGWAVAVIVSGKRAAAHGQREPEEGEVVGEDIQEQERDSPDRGDARPQGEGQRHPDAPGPRRPHRE